VWIRGSELELELMLMYLNNLKLTVLFFSLVGFCPHEV
jgi:hypothetical protein